MQDLYGAQNIEIVTISCFNILKLKFGEINIFGVASSLCEQIRTLIC